MQIMAEKIDRIGSVANVDPEIGGGFGTWTIGADFVATSGKRYRIETVGLASPPDQAKARIWVSMVALAINTGRNVGSWWREDNGTILAPCGAL